MCAIALLTLLLLTICFVRRNKGGKYSGKRIDCPFPHVHMLITTILQRFLSGGPSKAASTNIQLGFGAFDKISTEGVLMNGSGAVLVTEPAKAFPSTPGIFQHFILAARTPCSLSTWELLLDTGTELPQAA